MKYEKPRDGWSTLGNGWFLANLVYYDEKNAKAEIVNLQHTEADEVAGRIRRFEEAGHKPIGYLNVSFDLHRVRFEVWEDRDPADMFIITEVYRHILLGTSAATGLS